LILGYADRGASLGRPANGPENLDLWLDVQNAVLIAARAHDLQAIDGPFLGTADDGPFRAGAQRARDLGFDGKWAIHPSQVQALNDIFPPSAEELERRAR
jgi:citrate lyase subunit beta/citryl-CoA lyase